MASANDGVSRLHGAVTRQMWRGVWPRVPITEIPIGHVTNGVHMPTWDSDAADTLWTGAWARRLITDGTGRQLTAVEVERGGEVVTIGARWFVWASRATAGLVPRGATVSALTATWPVSERRFRRLAHDKRFAFL